MRIAWRTVIALTALGAWATLVAGLILITRTALIAWTTLIAHRSLFTDRLGGTLVACRTVASSLGSSSRGDGFGLVAGQADIRAAQTEQITAVAAQGETLTDDFRDRTVRDLGSGESADHAVVFRMRLALAGHRHDSGLS
jgi:hypothetical protein